MKPEDFDDHKSHKVGLCKARRAGAKVFRRTNGSITSPPTGEFGGSTANMTNLQHRPSANFVPRKRVITKTSTCGDRT